jgi:hypothetical protein
LIPLLIAVLPSSRVGALLTVLFGWA